MDPHISHNFYEIVVIVMKIMKIHSRTANRVYSSTINLEWLMANQSHNRWMIKPYNHFHTHPIFMSSIY